MAKDYALDTVGQIVITRIWQGSIRNRLAYLDSLEKERKLPVYIQVHVLHD